MKKILTINLKLLDNDECFGFLKFTKSSLTLLPQKTTSPDLPEVQSMTRLLELKSPRIQTVADKFVAAFEVFDAAMKINRKSPATIKIEAAEKNRNKAWSGAYSYICSMTNHPDATIAQLAKTAKDLFNKYENPNRVSQSKGTGIFHNLLQDIEALSSKEQLNIDVWYNWMKTAQDEFEEIELERAAIKDSRKKGETKQARLGAENAYKELANVVNSVVVAEESDECDAFIGTMNAEIERLSAISKRRSTRKKNDENNKEQTPEPDKPVECEEETPVENPEEGKEPEDRPVVE